jgi:hypothetical protein
MATKLQPHPVTATPEALRAMEESGQEWDFFVGLHLGGFWSDEDRRRNEEAMRRGRPLASAHRTLRGRRLLLVTDPRRSVTVILLADGPGAAFRTDRRRHQPGRAPPLGGGVAGVRPEDIGSNRTDPARPHHRARLARRPWGPVPWVVLVLLVLAVLGLTAWLVLGFLDWPQLSLPGPVPLPAWAV